MFPRAQETKFHKVWTEIVLYFDVFRVTRSFVHCVWPFSPWLRQNATEHKLNGIVLNTFLSRLHHLFGFE